MQGCSSCRRGYYRKICLVHGTSRSQNVGGEHLDHICEHPPFSPATGDEYRFGLGLFLDEPLPRQRRPAALGFVHKASDTTTQESHDNLVSHQHIRGAAMSAIGRSLYLMST